MKNAKLFLISLVFVSLSNSVLLAADTASVTLGKVVELGCHRLERLVTLGKIDESFLTKINSIQITKLQPTKPTDPSFKVVVTQYSGADGTANQVDLMMDANGKGIAQTLRAGADAQNAPVWNDKDAVSLVENSLHYIFESNDSEIKLFVTGLSYLRLKQVNNDRGEKSARVQMNSTDSSKILEITMKEDGTVESANTVNP
ncbi:MAG: hypothetical protein WC635_17440 [Bacteriovorax sp.]|jgi:hypothetical protein